MTSSLIGITGYLRTGKDSTAKLLVDEFGYTKLAFADPLREMARAIDPFIWLNGSPSFLTEPFGGDTLVLYSVLVDTVGYEKAKGVPDFRRFLQRLGTDGVRNILGDSTWVDLAAERAHAVLADGGKVVFSDVRFPNEADAVREMGGVVWRTVRPGFGGSGHVSETALDAIVPDVVLEAENLDQLAASVQLAMGHDVDPDAVWAWKEAVRS